MEEVWVNFPLFYIFQKSYNECVNFYNGIWFYCAFEKRVSSISKVLRDVPFKQ